MPRRLATAKIAQPMSTHSSPRTGHAQRSMRFNSVPLTPNGLDGISTNLRAQPADIDVHDVGTGIEVVAPDRGQDSVLAHGFAGARHQLPQAQKFPLGQPDPPELTTHLAAGQVE